MDCFSTSLDSLYHKQTPKNIGTKQNTTTMKNRQRQCAQQMTHTTQQRIHSSGQSHLAARMIVTTLVFPGTEAHQSMDSSYCSSTGILFVRSHFASQWGARKLF